MHLISPHLSLFISHAICGFWYLFFEVYCTMKGSLQESTEMCTVSSLYSYDFNFAHALRSDLLYSLRLTAVRFQYQTCLDSKRDFLSHLFRSRKKLRVM